MLSRSHRRRCVEDAMGVVVYQVERKEVPPETYPHARVQAGLKAIRLKEILACQDPDSGSAPVTPDSWCGKGLAGGRAA
jgi:hypothetical protein